jgi:signal transduction histidine kinase
VTAQPEPRSEGVASFRTKLLVATMLIVTAVTAAGLAFAQRSAASAVRQSFQGEFQQMLAASHAVQELRDAALAERCRALARRPRIHAALEDGAPDLLYPSARDEMADVMGLAREPAAYSLNALYYRFLDQKGRVMTPPDPQEAGALGPTEEAQLSLRTLPTAPQTGCIMRAAGQVDELVAMPIVSSESGEVISAIVVGFRAPWPDGGEGGIRSGTWMGGSLAFPSLGDAERRAVSGAMERAAAEPRVTEGGLELSAGGAECLLFYKLLNPRSAYAKAYEVSVYPLAGLLERQRRLLWQFGGAGALLLAGAFFASRALSERLSKPVERLAEDSEENRAHWHRAEAALEMTSRELQRSARFSADASHQLKTPVTVIRSGLEELLAGDNLRPEAREEVSGLVHQTFRLASIIEDLLLLSRMDAGRLQIQFSRLDLAALLAGLLDDLSAFPDGFGLEVEDDVESVLWITGEKRFISLILQNLLENARKYNRAGGRIRIASRREGEWAVVAIGNTGAPIPPSSQEHIFERFHRGTVGENVPGHGIGLNLARELARLHGGSLLLSSSDGDWTEFELRLRLADGAAGAKPS